MEGLLPIIIQLVSGAVGGNAAGAVLKKASMGPIGNSIAGILGGGVGGQLLGMLGMATGGGEMDMAGILSSVASGGAGGGVVMAVVGMIKSAMSK